MSIIKSLTIFVMTITLVWCCVPTRSRAGVGYTKITTQDLKERMDKGENIALINVLPKIIFDNKHISGSVNIPLGRLAGSPDLPVDKAQPLVFYCMGVL